MPEIADAVTMKGNPVTLLGNTVNVGDDAPNATLVANDLSAFELSSLKGKKVILSIVPSLDTGICDLQTKRFNQEAANLDNVEVLTISMDLPFAQARWCGATESTNVQTLSDYQTAQFGEAYGLLIKGLRLLARAVLVVDAKGTVQYKELVGEITTEPNYDAALDAVKNL
jgi:thiol peroxidase